MSETDLYYQLIAPIAQGGAGLTVLQAEYRLRQLRVESGGDRQKAAETKPA